MVGGGSVANMLNVLVCVMPWCFGWSMVKSVVTAAIPSSLDGVPDILSMVVGYVGVLISFLALFVGVSMSGRML